MLNSTAHITGHLAFKAQQTATVPTLPRLPTTTTTNQQASYNQSVFVSTFLAGLPRLPVLSLVFFVCCAFTAHLPTITAFPVLDSPPAKDSIPYPIDRSIYLQSTQRLRTPFLPSLLSRRGPVPHPQPEPRTIFLQGS
ncbi:hypothetical protein VTL71DRAFT_15427 [Oculimacula yallundae]|uniref:Uncharacterized protein n=1 Tax=Oculimacula yallundae TaxID=86028 RepID=A0ABR4CH60_9HELO